MKKYIQLLLLLTPFLTMGQPGSVTTNAVHSRTVDSTTVSEPSGYGTFWYSSQQSKWRVSQNGVRRDLFGHFAGGLSDNNGYVTVAPLGITNSMIANSTISLATKVTGLLPDGNIASASTWNAKQNQLNGTGFVKATGTTISYDNSTYLTANQSITWTAGGDVSGSASGTTSISPSLTVNGLKGSAVPSPTTGVLRWNGSSWIFDNSVGTGSVTSVGITNGSNITHSGGPITSSGNITINAVPSGSNTQIQRNSSGAFAGDPNFTWDGTTFSIGNGSTTGLTIVGEQISHMDPSLNFGIGVRDNTIGNGGDVTVNAGNSTGGNGNGGNLYLSAGGKNGSGTPGNVYLAPSGVGSTVFVGSPGISGNPLFSVKSSTTDAGVVMSLTQGNGSASISGNLLSVNTTNGFSLNVGNSWTLTNIPASGASSKVWNWNGFLVYGASAPSTGFVSSVGLSSTDLSVSGSPITTSGNITANLTTTGISAGTYTLANYTFDSKGRASAATAVTLVDYTPTVTSISNVSSTTTNNARSVDYGTFREVWMNLNVTPTTTGAWGNVVFRVSLPSSSSQAYLNGTVTGVYTGAGQTPITGTVYMFSSSVAEVLFTSTNSNNFTVDIHIIYKE